MKYKLEYLLIYFVFFGQVGTMQLELGAHSKIPENLAFCLLPSNNISDLVSESAIQTKYVH